MNHIASITTCTALCITGAAVAQTGDTGGPDDPGEAHEVFDFISAWGVHATEESGMALLPDSEDDPLNRTELHDVYDVGVSFFNDDAPSPSFEGYGSLEDLRIWTLPEEYGRTELNFDQGGGRDGLPEFRGSGEVRETLFIGRLSTYTGYDEIVTGQLIVSLLDIDAPEHLRVGSMMLVPGRQWASWEEGVEAMTFRAASMNGVPFWSDTEDDGALPHELHCDLKLRFDRAQCYLTLEHCRDQARINFEQCVASIGFGDVIVGGVQGGTAGGVLGGGVCGGIGFAAGGPPVAATGVTVGGIVGGVLGTLGGLWTARTDARADCQAALDADTAKCHSDFERCTSRAEITHLKCLFRID